MKVSSQFYHLFTQQVSKNLLYNSVLMIISISLQLYLVKVYAVTYKGSKNTDNDLSNIIYLVPENSFQNPKEAVKLNSTNEANIAKVYGVTPEFSSNTDNDLSNIIYLVPEDSFQDPKEVVTLNTINQADIAKVYSETANDSINMEVDLSNIIYLVPEDGFRDPGEAAKLKNTNQANISIPEGLTVGTENSEIINKQSQLPSESDIDKELNLKVRRKPVEGIPDIAETQLSPSVGFLRANVGYFNSSNIFSLQDSPIEDGLIFSGLTLSSTYLPVSNNTYINASIDGNLIRYINQSKYSYNQLRFNVGVYQQLSPKMYAEVGFSNQQLFYAHNSDFFSAGDRFLNENSVKLALGRRDNFSDKLVLDSVYELSANFSDPNSRSRIINTIALGLNYYIDKPLQVGLNYQFNLSSFTEQQSREDKYHRLYASLNFDVTKNSNVSLQSGFTFGDSTASNLDFYSWFFSVNYGLDLGRF